MLEKQILLLGFVRGMDRHPGTLAWPLEDAGPVSSNTKVAVLWMCHFVTDLRAVKYHGIQPVIHPTDSRPREREDSWEGIQYSKPVVKGVTTMVIMLSAGASAPCVVSSLREVVTCIHS